MAGASADDGDQGFDLVHDRQQFRRGIRGDEYGAVGDGVQISDRREFYNDSVNANNIRVEQFPDLIVARLFGFGLRDLLEFSEAEKADVNVKELFNS